MIRFPPLWKVDSRVRESGREAITVSTGGMIADVADGLPVPDDLTLTFASPPISEEKTAVRAIAVAMSNVLHEAMEWTQLGDPHPDGESYDWMEQALERLVEDYQRAFPCQH